MLKRNACAAALLLPLLGGLYCANKRMVGFHLIGRNVEIDPMTFGKTELDTTISEGKLVGFLEPFSAENNNQEADYSTSVQKQRRKRIPGIKGWKFIFDKSNCFQNEFNKLDNSESWSFVPVLEDGSALFYIKSNGKISGFDCDIFVGTYDAPLTADVTGVSVEIDLTPKGTRNWQNSADIFTPTEFRFDEINPIAGLNIEVPALVSGATTTKIKVKSLCSDSAITGLTDPTNWAVETDGVRVAPTGIAYDPVNSEYTFTHPALVAATSVSFVTTKNGFDIYAKDTSYYSGHSATKKVA
ncbi:hypothetical protein CMU89_17115 [Elizabethkingia anophelis]|nr:hypothetical protein [Elizabethkingia anophelis]MDV3544362.1 hypothetical protein [Elizabethkingia anophelis]